MYFINFDDKESKGTPWVSLSSEKKLGTLILSALNIFHQKYLTKSKMKLSLTIYLEYNLTILSSMDFIVLFS